jgi:hypothetical protein
MERSAQEALLRRRIGHGPTAISVAQHGPEWIFVD